MKNGLVTAVTECEQAAIDEFVAALLQPSSRTVLSMAKVLFSVPSFTRVLAALAETCRPMRAILRKA